MKAQEPIWAIPEYQKNAYGKRQAIRSGDRFVNKSVFDVCARGSGEEYRDGGGACPVRRHHPAPHVTEGRGP
ncbi:hypothetical protein GCM10007061_08070 [Kocuria marina]|nr:hypothetical protein GCM10007061_08070 [Kocuria marina]